MKTNRQCTSCTEDQVNGINLGFASNQKIIESYKDVTKFLHSLCLFWISLIYISLFSLFFFLVVYMVVKLNICVGVSFLSDMGVVNLFIYFGFWFFLYEKFLLSFMLIIIQKKKKIST